MYRNGTLALKGNVDGLDVDTSTTLSDDATYEYFLEDGRKLACWEEWFAFQSFDFMPRQMDGEPLKTEKEWRAVAAEMKAAVQD